MAKETFKPQNQPEGEAIRAKHDKEGESHASAGVNALLDAIDLSIQQRFLVPAHRFVTSLQVVFTCRFDSCFCPLNEITVRTLPTTSSAIPPATAYLAASRCAAPPINCNRSYSRETHTTCRNLAHKGTSASQQWHHGQHNQRQLPRIHKGDDETGKKLR